MHILWNMITDFITIYKNTITGKYDSKRNNSSSQVGGRKEISGGAKIKIQFYGLYKQAMEGDNTAAAPWAVQMEAKAKWDAWESRKGMSADDAKQAYVDLLTKVVGEQGQDWRA